MAYFRRLEDSEMKHLLILKLKLLFYLNLQCLDAYLCILDPAWFRTITFNILKIQSLCLGWTFGQLSFMPDNNLCYMSWQVK